MIYPTSLPSDRQLRGPKRPRLRLIDPIFEASWLGEAPFTGTHMLGGTEILSPKWLNGVKFTEAAMTVPDVIEGDPDVYPCCAPVMPELRGATAECPAPTPTAKETQPLGPEVQNLPFEIVAGSTCGIPGMGEDMPGWGHMRNLGTMDNWLSSVFAEALIDSPTADVTDNEGAFTAMSLQASRTCLVSSGAAMVQAFAAVDDGLTQLLGDEAGMIHLPPLAFSWVSLTSGIRFDQQFGHPISPNGHFIISEPGYANMPGPAGAESEEGADFIWGTPIVQWYHSQLYNPGGHDPTQWGVQPDVPLFDLTRNQVFAYDEVWGILIVRPCSVVAYGGYPRES